MPIVKTFTIGFPQSTGEREFRAKVHCSCDGSFTINLPDDVTEVIGAKSVTANTLAGVESAFKKALADYAAAQSTTRKVILYHLGLTAYLKDETGERCILRRDDVSFSKGAAMCLAAGVFIETRTTLANGAFRYVYKHVESSIPDFLLKSGRDDLGGARGEKDANALDWSPEREEFFRKIGAGLRAMMLQLDGAFAGPESLAALADAGRRTLLGDSTAQPS